MNSMVATYACTVCMSYVYRIPFSSQVIIRLSDQKQIIRDYVVKYGPGREGDSSHAAHRFKQSFLIPAILLCIGNGNRGISSFVFFV